MNVIESPQAGVRKKPADKRRWRDGAMVERWAAGAFLLTGKRFRKIMGYEDLSVSADILGRGPKPTASAKLLIRFKHTAMEVHLSRVDIEDAEPDGDS